MTRDRAYGPHARRYRWRVALADRDPESRDSVEELIGEQPGLDLVWSGTSVEAFRSWLALEPAAGHPVVLVVDDATGGLARELRVRGIGLVLASDDELVAAIWGELGRGRRLSFDELSRTTRGPAPRAP